MTAARKEAGGTPSLHPPAAKQQARPSARSFSLGRLWAYSRREALELLRDPIRMAFAFLGTAFLMIIFGFGITTDVDTLTFATLDRDQTPESRAWLGEVRGSRYFIEKAPAATMPNSTGACAVARSGRASRFHPGSAATSSVAARPPSAS
jgi:ribosome-dependent ATPase